MQRGVNLLQLNQVVAKVALPLAVAEVEESEWKQARYLKGSPPIDECKMHDNPNQGM